MSIVTKTGDNGTTGLMYNRRVSKCHPRVEAYGSVDELNAALGMARATAQHDFIRQNLFSIQKNLEAVMGEIATQADDLARYKKDGFAILHSESTAKLDHLAQKIEAQMPSFHGWSTPGENVNSAALDMARTTCRRAERCICAMLENHPLQNPEITIYLNRLSDVLWLMARWVELKLPPFSNQ